MYKIYIFFNGENVYFFTNIELMFSKQPIYLKKKENSNIQRRNTIALLFSRKIVQHYRSLFSHENLKCNLIS